MLSEHWSSSRHPTKHSQHRDPAQQRPAWRPQGTPLVRPLVTRWLPRKRRRLRSPSVLLKTSCFWHAAGPSGRNLDGSTERFDRPATGPQVRGCTIFIPIVANFYFAPCCWLCKDNFSFSWNSSCTRVCISSAAPGESRRFLYPPKCTVQVRRLFEKKDYFGSQSQPCVSCSTACSYYVYHYDDSYSLVPGSASYHHGTVLLHHCNTPTTATLLLPYIRRVLHTLWTLAIIFFVRCQVSFLSSCFKTMFPPTTIIHILL